MLSGVKKLLVGAAAALALTAPNTALADDFSLEGQTVTWIVGFSEGGGTDRLTRLLQAKLGEHLPGNPNVIVLIIPPSIPRWSSDHHPHHHQLRWHKNYYHRVNPSASPLPIVTYGTDAMYYRTQ